MSYVWGSNMLHIYDYEFFRLAEFLSGNKLGLRLGFPSDEWEDCLSKDLFSSVKSIILVRLR